MLNSSSSTTELVAAKRMDIYESFHQVNLWEDSFKVDHSTLNSISSPMLMMNNSSLENKSECIPHESREPSGDDQDSIEEPVPKVLRRQAQNREAARKCRLRKKAYVQQLETSRLKLMQLELEIEKTRKHGLNRSSSLDVGYIGSSRTINPGISLFEIEYGRWIEEQDRRNEELRNALRNNESDIQLHLLVESSLNQYSNLFRMKAEAAKVDVFYLISGAWKSPVERLFLWIGGSRPSQILNIVVPKLEALTDQQVGSINNLRLSSQQAEDALSMGLEKLQQSMIHNIQADPLDFGNYGLQMAYAMDKGEALEGFVNQADHLREQTLLYMSRILTIGQAAQGLLAMGEYFHRLRTLSSLWAARSCHHFYPTQHSN
ncbi:transcription factor TGA3-like [Vicia villosa]|uniref:transcription factor TGA3-like n=1 Tax=Vicia villosa TaxID=3911 RepID=UPI00273C6073|nr:transcription factor TGA3-like [Vicia villosa]XP_058744565.1 transcription factor TGA3-like [Vicia villosa]